MSGNVLLSSSSMVSLFYLIFEGSSSCWHHEAAHCLSGLGFLEPSRTASHGLFSYIWT